MNTHTRADTQAGSYKQHFQSFFFFFNTENNLCVEALLNQARGMRRSSGCSFLSPFFYEYIIRLPPRVRRRLRSSVHVGPIDCP